MTFSPQQILSKLTTWTKVKFHIQTSAKIPYFHERELWWASVGANVGSEQDGKNSNFERPVLIVKKFNKYMFWGIPQSSKIKQNQFYHQTTYDGKTYSLILSQMRVFSSKRLIRKVRTIPRTEFKEIRNKVKGFL